MEGLLGRENPVGDVEFGGIGESGKSEFGEPIVDVGRDVGG